MKKAVNLLFYILLFTAVITGNLSASESADTQVLLERAETAFAEGNSLMDSNPALSKEKYSEAVLNYNSITEMGIRNSGIYYNTGNAWFRLGKIGKAVLNYRRALLYSPADNQIRSNLEYARSLQKNRFTIDSENKLTKVIFFWHFNLPIIVKIIIMIIANLTIWLLFGLRLFGRRLPALTAAAVIVFIVFGISGYLDFKESRKRHGVITAESTEGRLGDSRSYESVFDTPLYEGAEFTVVQKRPGWILAQFINGEKAWIEDNTCELIEEL